MAPPDQFGKVDSPNGLNNVPFRAAFIIFLPWYNYPSTWVDLDLH
jgi:hypothetical protein